MYTCFDSSIPKNLLLEPLTADWNLQNIYVHNAVKEFRRKCLKSTYNVSQLYKQKLVLLVVIK